MAADRVVVADRANEDGDRADVERVLAGEIAAFENIVRRWQDPLVNLAYRFCRDRARAEEMAQEAFLRAWRAPHMASRGPILNMAVLPSPPICTGPSCGEFPRGWFPLKTPLNCGIPASPIKAWITTTAIVPYSAR